MVVISVNMLYLGGSLTGRLETCNTLRVMAKVTLNAVGTHRSRHFRSVHVQPVATLNSVVFVKDTSGR